MEALWADERRRRRAPDNRDMTLPPPRRTPSRRSPRVRHSDDFDRWAKVERFSRTALRAGAGDDVGSLTSVAKRKRFRLEGRSLRLVAIFLTVLGLSAAIAAFSSRSVEVSAIPLESSGEESTGQDLAGGEAASSPVVPSSQTPDPPEQGHQSQESVPQNSNQEIVVHVSGAVISPGVVTLDSPARVIDAVTMTGGPSNDANLALINLAQPLEDGAHIHVPADGDDGLPAGVMGSEPSPHTGESADGASSASSGSARVDINTASQVELETIPRIGPVTAQAIIAWRQENGAFTSVDQLIEVNGIGPKTLDQLRDYVRVS